MFRDLLVKLSHELNENPASLFMFYVIMFCAGWTIWRIFA